MRQLTQAQQDRLRACVVDESAYETILEIINEVTNVQTEQTQPTDYLHQSVICAMSEGVVVHASDGTIKSCNAAAERILGLTADQIMGRNSIDPRWHAIHEDGSPFPGETHPAMITLRTGTALQNIVMGVHKPDGSLTWISINSQPLTQPGELQLSGVVATFADITEKKQEAQLREAQQAELAAMYENVPIIMMLVDDQRRVRKINQTATRLLHSTEDELLGLMAGDTLRCIHAHDVKEGCGFGPACRGCTIRQTVLNTLKTGKSYEQVETEVRLSIRTTLLQVLLSTSPIEIDGVKHALVCIEDVTELKQSQKQAFQLAVEQERIQILSTFIRDTTHEFRTPLAVINTKSHLLERLSDPDKQHRHLDGIKKQTANLMNLVNNLLLLTRLDMSDLQENKPFDVNVCIEESR